MKKYNVVYEIMPKEHAAPLMRSKLNACLEIRNQMVIVARFGINLFTLKKIQKAVEAGL